MPTVAYDPERDHDRDLFAVLGVPWDATADSLRQAWRSASRTAHPDTGGSHVAFIEVQHAWEVLSDPRTRTRYVRAYEARHGSQRARATSTPFDRGSPSASGANGSSPGRPTDADVGRCEATTRDGRRCRNRASPAAGRCPVHGGTPRPPWRCVDDVTFEGSRLPCFYNRLVGEERCWDHASESERGAAQARVGSGGCLAVTLRGEPCRSPRSSLGLPVCDRHLTLGLLAEYRRRHPGPDLGRRPSAGPDARAATRADTPDGCEPEAADMRGTVRDPVDQPESSFDADAPIGDGDRSGRSPASVRPGPSVVDAPTDRPASPEGPAGAAASRSGPSPAPPPVGPSVQVVNPSWTPRPSDAGRVPRTVRPDRASQSSARPLVFTVLAAVVVVGAVAVGVARWREGRDDPVMVSFSEGIKATSAECTSVEPLLAADVVAGFEMTCTMTDESPGNRDRPYVQLRLDGCDDWQRLDHDDGPEPVAITVQLEPCVPQPGEVGWQVCQTHGGLLPDDCDDGATELPTH